MPSKQAILDNVELYNANELVSYIKSGIVTLDELCNETDGYFTPKVRKEVELMIAGSEEEDWNIIKESNSEDELMRFIKSYPESPHCDEARQTILNLSAKKREIASIDEWSTVDKNSLDSLQDFIKNNKDDVHCNEARRLINKIQTDDFLGFDIVALIDRINAIQTDKNIVGVRDDVIFEEMKNYIDQKKVQSSDVLNAIKRDNNLLRASVLNKLIANGYFKYDDFLSIGIDIRFIQQLAKKARTQEFSSGEKIVKINKRSTEVYFWGIPSSGKSCALGAILSVANNGRAARSMSKDNDCQGYGYMTRLAQLFRSDETVGILPEGTSIYSTYEMGFDLEDENNATHPMTCVDLAGELVRCMYKSDAHESLTDDEVESLDTLTRILIDNRTQNRKIHFFVVEYNGESRKYEGLSQNDYLSSALRYIERTGIFKKDTDAIYLMITKVDKANAEGGELQKKLREYINGSQYKGFYHGLEKICRECEINGGVVEIIPFSLGKVCFQDYCLFNEVPAANVVHKLLVRSWSTKNGKLQKGLNQLKK